MNRNSIILMDKIPARSTAYRTAEHRGVKLIQLRNNNPVEEIRQHPDGLGVSVRGKPIAINQVEKSVLRMPLSAFDRK